MNSSDSEEDFESADEDLDLNKPLQSQNEKENIKIYKSNEDAINKNTSSEAPATEILENLERVTLKDESLDNESVTVQQPETTQNEATQFIDFTSPETKGTKIECIPKKLGTKLTNESDRQQKEDKSQSGLQNQNEKHVKERKMKPSKLGMKLTSEEKVVKTNVNDDRNRKTELLDNNKDNIKEKYQESEKSLSTGDDMSLETVIKPSSTITLEDKTFKAGDGWEIEDETDVKPSSTITSEDVTCEAGKVWEIEEETDVKPSSTIKLEDVTFEAGDGWEIEEEDGFEIPVTLAKSGDGGIQCPQEQISELGQDEMRPSKTDQEQSWGGWGGWGVSSLLSTASGTVTTFSSQVTAGLSTVLETTIGAPNPETLAAEQTARQEVKEEQHKTEDQMDPGYGGLGSIMTGVSFLGASVINRGLDTLETIGKKTMEVLQEGDPGLKKKRALLFRAEDKPILSQILREAKERADNSDKEKEEKEAARKIHFESLFDDFQGMVHLEALEMLSTQCELKLQTLLQSHSGPQLLDLQETLSQVRELCEVAEDEEDSEVLTAEQFADKLAECTKLLRINLTPAKIVKVNGEVCTRLGSQSAAEVNQAAIESLADHMAGLTAAAMEFFHKSAELVMAKPAHSTADEAEGYVQLTNHLCARISAVANEFTQLLTKNDPIANSSLITNIFLEASNSSSYIKNACQLLVPILQVGAVAS